MSDEPIMDPVHEDFPEPTLEELQQRQLAYPAVPVQMRGPVQTHELPSRMGVAFTLPLSTDWQNVSGKDLSRKRMMLVSDVAILVSHTASGAGAPWPAGVPLPLAHADQVYAKINPNVTPTVLTNTSAVGGAAPAAGAEWSASVPAGEVWTLQAIDVSLQTAVAAANRRVSIIIDDGTNVLAKITSGVDQTASLTWEYIAALGGTDVANTVRDAKILLTLPQIPLLGGYRIRSLTTNLQAADQWLSAPRLTYTKQTTPAVVAGNLSVIPENWAD